MLKIGSNFTRNAPPGSNLLGSHAEYDAIRFVLKRYTKREIQKMGKINLFIWKFNKKYDFKRIESCSWCKRLLQNCQILTAVTY